MIPLTNLRSAGRTFLEKKTYPVLLIFTFLFNTVCSADSHAPVKSGLDVLVESGFADLQGMNVGVIVNHSSIDGKGNHLIDLLAASDSANLKAIFTPEHGLKGTADNKVSDGIHEATGLPVYSLYGKTRRPTLKMLEGLDVLIFDIQDIGARFYTYIATMGNCMEVAKEAGIKFIVLDRPNPLGGTHFDGPIQDQELVGNFTAFRLMPILHGMTVGEMAHYFNRYDESLEEGDGIRVNLQVIKAEGWKRGMYFDQTGLPWVNPSPNMRSLDQEILYTMICLIESNKKYSVGRGTERPFEYVGAPTLDAKAFVDGMRAKNIPGIWVMETTFMPRKIDVTGRENYPYQFTEQICKGARFIINKRDAFEPIPAGFHMMEVLNKVSPDIFVFDKLHKLVGSKKSLEDLEAGKPVEDIVKAWREDPRFRRFKQARQEVLLYD